MRLHEPRSSPLAQYPSSCTQSLMISVNEPSSSSSLLLSFFSFFIPWHHRLFSPSTTLSDINWVSDKSSLHEENDGSPIHHLFSLYLKLIRRVIITLPESSLYIAINEPNRRRSFSFWLHIISPNSLTFFCLLLWLPYI